jgi:hypothetical protein
MPAARILAKGEEKQEREAIGNFTHMAKSANFVLKWNDAISFPAEMVTEVLQDLETTWQVEIDEMQYHQPVGTETYLYNVYIGDDGSTYSSIDDDGYPYMVIDSSLTEDGNYTPSTLAHEFFHAIQFATNAYTLDIGYWLWEATADWILEYVFPETIPAFIGAYLLLSELSVNYYDRRDKMVLKKGHIYGAAIFIISLTNITSTPDLIYQWWNTGGAEDDPLLVLDELLQGEGTSLAEAFSVFTAHAAAYDFEDGAEYKAQAENYAHIYRTHDDRIVAVIPPAGTAGWVMAPRSTLPWGYGFNVLRMASPNPGDFSIAVQGDTLGSNLSPATFSGTIFREFGDQVRYEKI